MLVSLGLRTLFSAEKKYLLEAIPPQFLGYSLGILTPPFVRSVISGGQAARCTRKLPTCVYIHQLQEVQFTAVIRGINSRNNSLLGVDVIMRRRLK